MENKPLNYEVIDEKTINDGVFALLSKPQDKLDVFIHNMYTHINNYNLESIDIDNTYIDNIETVVELIKHENVFVTVLPIVRFKTKTYSIGNDNLITFDEIKSAVENNKDVIIYIAVNNFLNKFRAIIVE